MQDLYMIWDNKFAKRVIDYLQQYPEKIRNFVGLDRVPPDVDTFSADFIDEIEENLPQNLPASCDILIAIGIDMYIQALPRIAERTGAEAVIVPIEDSGWYPLGILNQVKRDLERIGVEVAFPRPFCSLEGKGRESIEKFVEDYGIGRPSMTAKVSDGEILDVEVEVSAPCGSTHSVAERIIGASSSFESEDILDLEGRISEAHHSHPCTADMMEDPVLSETILHRAGYLVRDAVKRAIGLTNNPDTEERDSGRLSEECPRLCGECVKVCKKSGNDILEMNEDEGTIVIPNYGKCIGCRSCVKKCPIHVAGKIVTKRDNSLLDEWEHEEFAN